MGNNPIDGFTVDAKDIQYIGHDLQRPECILAERDGTLWSADARGGVVRIAPDGSQTIITQSHQAAFAGNADAAKKFTEGTLPNGLAFAENGDLLIANFGTDCLEVMTRDGETKVLHDSIDGNPIGKVNYVLRDSRNRIWITVSTKITNWMKAISPNVKDGYIALLDGDGLRIVADGLAFTNEIRLDAKEEWMYIVETCGQCISRMRVGADGSLSGYEVFGPSALGTAGFPDGIAFDSFGNLWGTLIMADQIYALTPEGDQRILFDDGKADASRALEEAFQRDEVTPDHMLAAMGTIAPWTASITFGGPDLRTVYVGSLRGTRIPYFQSPVAGLPMVHW
ncbi:MAG: SMP-30/gluconolactonase/LRE family protein [Proteobacteria bacterium]|nr:SMP-30/gluconolactonase/LRE family protein [Pseudomonadota bacterium]